MRTTHLVYAILACMSAVSSFGMESDDKPLSFFTSQALRLRDLQVRESQLQEYPIHTLLEKRNGVAQLYLSTISHLLDMPAERFPSSEAVVSKLPRSPEVLVCYKSLFKGDPKAAAIGVLTYRFHKLMEFIDKMGGPELAKLVGPNAQMDSAVGLMLDAVRLRVNPESRPCVADASQAAPDNDPSSSYGSESPPPSSGTEEEVEIIIEEIVEDSPTVPRLSKRSMSIESEKNITMEGSDLMELIVQVTSIAQ
jgi:hypothetical protein